MCFITRKMLLFGKNRSKDGKLYNFSLFSFFIECLFVIYNFFFFFRLSRLKIQISSDDSSNSDED